MRSSEVDPLWRRHRGAALVVAMLAVGCSGSGPPAAEQPAAVPSAVECAAGPGMSAEAASSFEATRRAAESSPLYAALAARSPVTSCGVTSDGAKVTLDYAFKDGGALSFVRDPALEYSNQELRFGGPVGDDAVALLQRVERSSFAPDGCSIDWKEATFLPPASGISEAAYYGDVCNCQARVRRDGSAQLVGLTFRSAC